MKTLNLNKKTLEKYEKEFKKGNSLFSYNYEWTEKWADTPIYDGKSFKELLVWKTHSLWYFYEYLLRDTYGYEGFPFYPFPSIFFRIDLYSWIIKKENPDKICAQGIYKEDLMLIEKVCKKNKVCLEIINLKRRKKRLIENNHLVINFIKTRLFLRWIISKTRKKDNSKKDVILLTNDRHSQKNPENDAFFGSIIKELKNNRVSFKLIEYDRPHSPDNFTNILKKYLFRKISSNFVGDYYTLKNISKIFKTSKEFELMGKRIISRKEFAESLKYKGIYFYPFVKDRIQFIFSVMSYYIADVLIITDEILQKEMPKAVLLEHEKNFYDKGMIVNAKKLETKTVCFEGEMVYENNNYLKSSKTKSMNCCTSPLWRPLPDIKFVWGEYSKNWFIKNAQYPKDMLKIIGAPKYDYTINKFKSSNRKDLLKKYGLKNKKTVLILTGVVWTDELLYESLKALKDKKTQIIIKLHPDDSKKKISRMIKRMCCKFKMQRPTILKYADFSELLAISDLVLAYQSTLVYEIMLSNKQVIVLKFYKDFDLHLPYSTGKIVPIVENKDELKKTIEKYLEKGGCFSSKDKKRFIKKHLYLQDGKAGCRAVKIIRGVLNE